MSRENYHKLLDIRDWYTTQSISRETNYRTLKTIFTELGLFVPENEILEKLTEDNALFKIFQTFLTFYPNDKPWHDFKKINPSKQITGPSYVYRHLDVRGVYPSYNLKTEDYFYFIADERPRLVIKTPADLDTLSPRDSELHYFNRMEIAFAASVACTRFQPDLTFYLHESRGPSIYASSVTHEDEIWNMISAYREIFQAVDTFRRYPPDENAKFRYVPTDHSAEIYENLQNFSLNDDLLLRVATTFVKGKMLLTHEMFHEEGLANLFFALEGCLHLIQRKAYPNLVNFELKVVTDFIEKTFPDGKYHVRDVREFYMQRLQIVHPKSRYTTDWVPTLFFEDIELCVWLIKRFLNYIIRDKIIDPE